MLKTNKPSGINTHKVSDEKPIGFYELLLKDDPNLKLIHRLDQGTSGAMVFAQDQEETKALAKAFEQHEVDKTYIFLSKNNLDLDEDTRIDTLIEKKGNQWISRQDGKFNNASTVFTKVRAHKDFTLYKANPITGKTHQIRLHARDLGIPILGDELYGGASFHRLALHCLNIEFKFKDETIKHLSNPPVYFTHLQYLESNVVCEFADQMFWRQCLYPDLLDNEFQSVRVSHETKSGLRADKLGKVYWLGWWSDSPLPEKDLELLKKLLEHHKVTNYLCQWRTNREKDKSNAIIANYDCPETWIAKEGDIKLELRRDQGFSPGVFLDQRANRKWVKENSQNLNVLNLFSYTSAFSVFAAKGMAKEVASVDLSQNYINWSKKNFQINDMDTDSGKYSFYAMGAFEYLQWAFKKQKYFDLIICDPPSFGRNNKKVFKLENDWKDLISEMAKVLNEKGKILFSCNLEKWTQKKMLTIMQVWAKRNGFKVLEAPEADYDFESPNKERILKSIIFEKKAN